MTCFIIKLLLVFECVIFNQLYTYLDHNNLLSEQQYKFRANHSADLAAIKSVDYIGS